MAMAGGMPPMGASMNSMGMPGPAGMSSMGMGAPGGASHGMGPGMGGGHGSGNAPFEKGGIFYKTRICTEWVRCRHHALTMLTILVPYMNCVGFGHVLLRHVQPPTSNQTSQLLVPPPLPRTPPAAGLKASADLGSGASMHMGNRS